MGCALVAQPIDLRLNVARKRATYKSQAARRNPDGFFVELCERPSGLRSVLMNVSAELPITARNVAVVA